MKYIKARDIQENPSMPIIHEKQIPSGFVTAVCWLFGLGDIVFLANDPLCRPQMP